MALESISIRAAGVVPVRDSERGREVLVVHRPHRSDWSLPKGKVEGDEHIIVTATRECLEETGMPTTLGAPLPTQIYPVDQRLKSVRYWISSVDHATGFTPNSEVDEIRWVDADQARSLLSYGHDADLVDLAMATPATTPLIILRHTQATKRQDYTGEIDSERPLAVRGFHQADDLVALMTAFGVTRVHSSPARRCVETVQPLADAIQAELILEPTLSEEGFEEHPFASTLRLGDLLRVQEPTVVCTHRPVMPALMDGLCGVSGAVDWVGMLDPKLAPGSFVVLHRGFGADGAPSIVSVERHTLAAST